MVFRSGIGLHLFSFYFLFVPEDDSCAVSLVILATLVDMAEFKEQFEKQLFCLNLKCIPGNIQTRISTEGCTW